MADVAADPDAALRVLDLWGWLHALPEDLARVERVIAAAPPLTADRQVTAPVSC